MSLRKKLTILTLAGALALSSCNISERKEVKKDLPHPEAINYVTSNLGDIISSQEKTIGIKHFGLPKIVFKGCGFRGDRESYNPDTNTLTIYMPRAHVHFSPLTTEDIIRHGLGHFYVDKLSESLGNGSWPPDDKDNIDYVRKRLVFEGIGEYFRRKSFNEKDNFKDSQWPKTIEEFEKDAKSLYYTGGYHLVKPIIDKHGQKGIEFLITVPPEKEDLVDLPGYQRKALKYLES